MASLSDILSQFWQWKFFFKKPIVFRQNYFLSRLVEVINDQATREPFAKAVSALRTRVDPSRAEVENAIGADATRLFEQSGIVRSPLEREHLENDWFGGWFPNQPVASLLITAIDIAIREALNAGPPRRVEFYWTVSANSNVKFSLAISPAQITVVAQTPEPAYERSVTSDDAIDPISTVELVGGAIVLTPVRRISLVGNDQILRTPIPRLVNRARGFFGT